MFNVTFNTFCLVQDNHFAKCDENSLGKVEVSEKRIQWTVTKKDIDIACKDKRFSEEFKVSMNFSFNLCHSYMFKYFLS